MGGDRKCVEALSSVSLGSLKQKRVEKLFIGGDDQQGYDICYNRVTGRSPSVPLSPDGSLGHPKSRIKKV